jgi:hypothetical protein
VFETPPPADAAVMRLYPSAPHPFVLRELDQASDGQAALMLTLVGQAQELLPLLVQALRRAGIGPHGIQGHQLHLREVCQERGLGCNEWERIDGPRGLQPLPCLASDIPPPPTDAVRLRFVTPLRIKREGNSLGAVALDFAALAGTLVRRISMLQAFHTDTTLQAPFAEFKERAREVRMRSSLVPVQQQRFSNRQRRTMPMDGLLGHVEIDAADALPFWPFLWLGQYVHVGSAATMGLGCYEIEPAAASLPVAARAA